MSPVITVGPVLVMPDPASTPKLPEVPRPTGACAAPALVVDKTMAAPTATAASNACLADPRREGTGAPDAIDEVLFDNMHRPLPKH